MLRWMHTFGVIALFFPAFAVADGGQAGQRAAAGEDEPVAVEILAPGWGKLEYELPTPGSYDLPKIRKAADGEVLLSDGSDARLQDYLHGKISVLSFIYTQCQDVNGCPLATFVLQSLKKSLKRHSHLSNEVRFVSISFDYERDTPEVMRDYARDFQGGESEWLFMTTESDAKLRPILKEYSQYVNKARDEEGGAVFAHILRAYLVDAGGYIRNIYSVDFLHPDLLMADIETVLLETRASRR